MAQALLGSFNGTVTAGVNMLDIFKENELKENPNSILKFGDMILKKLSLSCAAGTTVIINGKEIVLASGLFELGMNQVDVYSLTFPEAVAVNIYYMY